MNKQTQKTMFSSESNEWGTPQMFFDKLNRMYGPFTLDAAASDDNYKVERYYTKADNALSKNWSGNKVFLNSPYGRELKKWVKKAYEEGQKNHTMVVMLIPARTDTRYWHDYVMKADEILFVRGRLKFTKSVQTDKLDPAPFPSAVVVFRKTNFIAPRITVIER